MGEIADAMIYGELDYVTGEYLGDPVGYPRTRTKKRKKNKKNILKTTPKK